MTANCANCEYSQVDVGTDEEYPDGPLMRCHRYPPTVIGMSDGDVAQTWPNVGSDDWCGEHRPEPVTLYPVASRRPEPPPNKPSVIKKSRRWWRR